MNFSSRRIAVVGLGYVGLPLAVEFAKKIRVIGFDINEKRINDLSKGLDSTLEISSDELKNVLSREGLNEANGFYPTNMQEDLRECSIYIVTVPTPTDKHNRPVLTPLLKASETISQYLKKGDVVIYESTVYPGVTEDDCVPVLERKSGLKFNRDFFVGYSPERINPGDKEHTVSKILKVTSGSTPETAELVDQLYKTIITAGTYKASSIKVAEAAKVIENSQRDINIAFVNELSKIFNLLDIDTNEVLAAAETKWNFLKFKPGLVGGHCIGVDPYYLAQKAQEVGYHPEIILAGRRLNDGMGRHIAQEVIRIMIKKQINVSGAKILLLGFTFKENCPDIRNTRVIDILRELESFHTIVDIYDPWVDAEEVKEEYGLEVLDSNYEPDFSLYSSVILAVAHEKFAKMKIRNNHNTVVFDVKGVLPKEFVDGRL